MDPAEMAGLIVACSTFATVITTLIGKWMEERRQRILAASTGKLEVEKVEHVSVEAAAAILERYATRLESSYERERVRREGLEQMLSDYRAQCPVGFERCPLRANPKGQKRG